MGTINQPLVSDQNVRLSAICKKVQNKNMKYSYYTVCRATVAQAMQCTAIIRNKQALHCGNVTAFTKFWGRLRHMHMQHPLGHVQSGVVAMASSKKNSNTVSYQRELSSSEKKALRTKSQQLAQSLVTVNCGANGASVAFLSGLFSALHANTMVKVRLGCSRGAKEELTKEICSALDCVCIHSIGSVITLYRQKGLPKPPGLQQRETDEENELDSSTNSQSTSILYDDEDASSFDEDDEDGTGAPADAPAEFTVVVKSSKTDK